MGGILRWDERWFTECPVFVEYDGNVVPLIEWCTAHEWCADRLVSVLVDGSCSLVLLGWSPVFLFYYWRAVRSPIVLGLLYDCGLLWDWLDCVMIFVWCFGRVLEVADDWAVFRCNVNMLLFR